MNVVREDGDDAGEVALSSPTKRGPDRWVQPSRSFGSATRGSGVVNKTLPMWASACLSSDVNEQSVDERSIASDRLPTSLKHEGATRVWFSAQ